MFLIRTHPLAPLTRGIYIYVLDTIIIHYVYYNNSNRQKILNNQFERFSTLGEKCIENDLLVINPLISDSCFLFEHTPSPSQEGNIYWMLESLEQTVRQVLFLKHF